MDVAELALDVDSRPIKGARDEMDRFVKAGRGVDGTARGVEKSTKAMGAAMARAAVAATAAIGALAGMGQAVGVIREFESSMSQVAAITRASTVEIEAMRDAAKELGSTTEFSAAQAADGLRFLGMAGFEASEAIQAIPAVLDLATASSMDLAQSADIASNVLSGFGLAAGDAAQVADVLAAASSRSNTSVAQLGGAMSTAAPIAAALDISLQDTAAAIGVMSDAGIQGERAGTALRGVLASLAGPTEQAKEALKQYGLTAAQVNPESVALADIFALLRERGLSTADAMAIFGREAASGALVLTEASARVGAFGDELEEAEGAASEMAGIMRDNLGGAANTLMSSVQGLAIALGEAGLTAVLTTALNAATAAARALTALVEVAGRITAAISGLFDFGSAMDDVARASDIANLAIADQVAQHTALTRALEGGRSMSLDYAGAMLENARATLAAADASRERRIQEIKSSEVYQELVEQQISANRLVKELQNLFNGNPVSAELQRMADASLEVNGNLDGMLALYQSTLEKLRANVAEQKALTGTVDGTNDEVLRLEAEIRLLQAGIAAAKDGVVILGSETGDAADTTAALARLAGQVNFDSAAVSAQNLASWLGISLSRAMALAATTPMMADEDLIMSQQVIPDAEMRDNQRTAAENFERMAASLERVGTSGGGASKAMSDLEKQTKKTAEEIEKLEFDADPAQKYAAELKELDAIMATGQLSEGAYQKAVQDLNDELANQVPMVNDVADAWGEFVADGFRDFNDFKDAILGSFKNLISQMVATAARNQILFSMGVTGSVAGTAASAAGGAGEIAGGGGILGNVLGGGGLLGNLLGGTGGLLGGVMGGAQAALGLGGFSSAGIFNIGANAAVASAATGAGSLASTIGAALPAVGLVAGGIALISSFFKTTTKLLNEGLRVEVEDSVTSIRQFQDIQKKKYWGLSKSNSRNFSEVPEEFQRAWDNTLSGITGALGSAAEQLGLAGENFLSVWDGYNMDISTKGLSEDEIQQKVSEFFQQYASDIVAYGLDKSGVGMFAVIRDEVLREGEELSDGFIRMGNAISAANRNLRDLNVALFDISVQGGVYAAQFADMFGGVENMQAAMNGYIQAMFSEQGQLIVRQRRLVEALSSVGVGLPATSEAYREMVEAQDLTTERGREVAATLIQLSGEFVALEDALGSLGYTVAGLSTAVIEATFSAEDALEAARARAVQEYQNVMRLFGEQIRAAEQAAAEIRRVFDILDDALASRGLLSERAEMMRRETALNELRAGINDPDRLRDVVRTLNAPSEQYFGNAIDYARDFAITSGAMAAQRDIAKEQLTEAEQQIVLLEEQRDAIEDQYAEILGINEGVTTLNEAIAQLDLTMQEVRDATMRVEQAMLSLANSMLGAISGIAGAGGAAGLGMAGIDQFDENRTNAILSDAATSTFTGVAETINRLYRDTLGRNVDAAGLEFYGGLLQSGQANAARIGFELATSQEAQSGVTPGFGEIGSAQPVNTIDALYSSMLGREADAAGRAFWESTGLQGEDLINAFRDGAIANGDTPAFAMGGMHTGGLRIVGENGPELEATGPSRIYSARQTREIMQPGTTLGAEMRQLIEYTRQLVKINNKQERALREIELQGETA